MYGAILMEDRTCELSYFVGSTPAEIWLKLEGNKTVGTVRIFSDINTLKMREIFKGRLQTELDIRSRLFARREIA